MSGLGRSVASAAYASLAGLPPQAGLYCYLAGGLAFALLGTSRAIDIGDLLGGLSGTGTGTGTGTGLGAVDPKIIDADPVTGSPGLIQIDLLLW